MSSIVYNESIAQTYDNDREHEEHWKRESDFIEKYLVEKTNYFLVDIPVGTGRFFNHYTNASKIYGIDISPHMLKQAQKTAYQLNLSQLLLSEGSATNIKLDDQSVDTLVCFRLFHLINKADRLSALKEFSRVTRGQILLQVYLTYPINLLDITRYYLNKITRILSKRSNHNCAKSPWSHIRNFTLTEKELNKIIATAGLKIVDETDIGDYDKKNVRIIILENQHENCPD